MRRGVDRAEIYGIALSRNVQWLAVSSDKGTVHIFSLRVRVAGEDSSSHLSPAQGPALLEQNSSSSLDGLISPSTSANPGSSLSFMRGKKALLINGSKDEPINPFLFCFLFFLVFHSLFFWFEKNEKALNDSSNNNLVHGLDEDM